MPDIRNALELMRSKQGMAHMTQCCEAFRALKEEIERLKLENAALKEHTSMLINGMQKQHKMIDGLAQKVAAMEIRHNSRFSILNN